MRNVAHQFDENGNLLWAGGSADTPWIVTTFNPNILNKEWVGGKSSKQADIFRKLNGLDENMSEKSRDIIQQLKNLPLKVIAENQFAVTDFAYQLFINPILSQLKGFLDRDVLDLQNNESFSSAEEKCQNLIKQENFSNEFIEAVKIAFEWLDKKNPNAPRAVRSTAPSEDGGEFSGSGKYSTKLRQFGFEEVLNSIKDCFISRFNRGALHYQFSAPQVFGEDLASLSFAVMVQDMQPQIDIAGTIFTADTQSNHSGFVEINFTYGLGEAVVSGRVSSDS
jgi:pyruvate, water dikinase